MSTPDGGRLADYGPPRRVEGGLRARSTRGSIGRSWWSRRFVEVLESFALGTRLTRGRAYARAGQVLALDVTPGVVTAVVQGSRPEPYRVRIELARLPEPLWAELEAALAAQAFFSARLLAGDLPAELEELFAATGAPLFPAGIGELRQRCSCPDSAVPCKHLAATFYLLAEAFDADPFRLLHWRGRDRSTLLDRLRALRTGAPATGADSSVTGVDDPVTGADGPGPPGGPTVATCGGAAGGGSAGGAAGSARVLGDLPAAPLDDARDRFWLSPVPLPDRPPTLATGPDLLLRQLGPPGSALGGPGLTERLRPAYRRFGDPTDAQPGPTDPDGGPTDPDDGPADVRAIGGGTAT